MNDLLSENRRGYDKENTLSPDTILIMKPLLTNRKARYEYEVIDTFTAGVMLSGGEVKMLRGKHGSLNGSYVHIKDGEAWLLNMQIPPYPNARNEEYEPTRTRKLLLKKSELVKFGQIQATKGISLIPLEVGVSGRYIKVAIGVARGKSARDKRDTIRQRDLDREMRRGE